MDATTTAQPTLSKELLNAIAHQNTAPPLIPTPMTSASYRLADQRRRYLDIIQELNSRETQPEQTIRFVVRKQKKQ